MEESLASYSYLKDLVASESLDADLLISGRFFGAYTPAHYERLRGQGRLLRERTGVTVHEIDRASQRSVIGSDYYHGGIVVDEYGDLHTAKYPRMLFGSRPSIREISEQQAAVLLHKKMVQVWPELRDVKVSHAWKGYVAMTFDKIAHIGEEDGLHYAVGCNGNGVALMTYLGYRIARKVLGKPDSACAFDEGPFPGNPLGGEQSWVVPFGAALYEMGDRLDALGRRPA